MSGKHKCVCGPFGSSTCPGFQNPWADCEHLNMFQAKNGRHVMSSTFYELEPFADLDNLAIRRFGGFYVRDEPLERIEASETIHIDIDNYEVESDVRAVSHLMTGYRFMGQTLAVLRWDYPHAPVDPRSTKGNTFLFLLGGAIVVSLI